MVLWVLSLSDKEIKMNKSENSLGRAEQPLTKGGTGASPVSLTIKQKEKLRKVISKCDREITFLDQKISFNRLRYFDKYTEEEIIKLNKQRREVDDKRKEARITLKRHVK